jgi:hypothetical protein
VDALTAAEQHEAIFSIFSAGDGKPLHFASNVEYEIYCDGNLVGMGGTGINLYPSLSLLSFLDPSSFPPFLLFFPPLFSSFSPLVTEITNH